MKDRIITLRLTPAEWDGIEEMAARFCMTAHEYILAAAMNELRRDRKQREREQRAQEIAQS